jgi:hypothetical protein
VKINFVSRTILEVLSGELMRGVHERSKMREECTLGARGDVLTQYIASTLLVLGQ